jgi:hypothetical protein
MPMLLSFPPPPCQCSSPSLLHHVNAPLLPSSTTSMLHTNARLLPWITGGSCPSSRCRRVTGFRFSRL